MLSGTPECTHIWQHSDIKTNGPFKIALYAAKAKIIRQRRFQFPRDSVCRCCPWLYINF